MAGWKQWASGEVVEHTEFQTFLQDQVVQTFSGTAARGSVLGTAVAEGMVAYLEDTNRVEVYDGSDWFQLASTAGTVAFATLAGTATFATNAGTAVFATNAGTASHSDTSGTATYATLAGTADFASQAGTAVTISGSITSGQVTGTAVTLADTGTVTNTMLAGSIANDKLVNSGITLNGSAVSLGGSLTISDTGFTNPMTSVGDLIVGTTAGAADRLAIGAAGRYLFSNGTVSSWAEITTLGAVSTTSTATTGSTFRNITMSTATPTGGADGDVWLQYTP